MNPEDMALPQANEIAVAGPQLSDRICKILYAVDPARLRKIGPDIIDVVIRDQIEHQIRLAELNLEFEQKQLATLRNIQQRL